MLPQVYKTSYYASFVHFSRDQELDMTYFHEFGHKSIAN